MTHSRTTTPCWLDPEAAEIVFPDVERALQEPDGLLAVGGKLTVDWLLQAYRRGIFPWYGQGQPILWWAPDPRLVLFPENLHISRSLDKIIKKGQFTVTLDTAFAEVIDACARPRPLQSGTWITPEMKSAYVDLHHAGHAHSVESWCDGMLAGGLYGIAIGNIFFGESMFTEISDASKAAFVALARQLERWGFTLIDCQVYTQHLVSLGAATIPRKEFTAILDRECWPAGHSQPWVFDAVPANI
jgi:leucyl/phenylalanyl-tRNA--protein transferase